MTKTDPGKIRGARVVALQPQRAHVEVLRRVVAPSFAEAGDLQYSSRPVSMRNAPQEPARLADETVDLSVLKRDTAMFVEQIQGTQRLVAVSITRR